MIKLNKFEDLIGHEIVIEYLKKCLVSRSLPKTLILFGEAGVGKTTLARILARTVMCDDLTACGKCSSCESFLSDKNLDYYEIDGALHSNVENVRDMIEIAGYKPQLSNNRVFVIDECQRLSQAAFSALLKTLEESDPCNYFFMVTTHVDRLPDSIISRSVRIKLKKPSLTDITSYIANKYPDYSKNEISGIIELSSGRPRDINNHLEIYSRIRDLNFMRKLLGQPRSSTLKSYWFCILNSNVNLALRIMVKIINQTGGVWSALNHLLEQLKIFPNFMIERVSVILTEISSQSWLNEDNIIELFTRILCSNKNSRIERLLYKVAINNPKLYWKLIDKKFRITVNPQGKFEVIGDLNLSQKLKDFE